MRVLVIGAGAIGCLIGAKFASSGQTTTLVGRRAVVEAIHARGLWVVDDTSEQRVEGRLTTISNIAQAFAEPWQEYDLAVLTVKSYDTAGVIDELASATPTPPPILSLQNGVGNEEALAAAFGRDRVMAGTLTTPVSVIEPGKIRIERPSYNLLLAEWQPGALTSLREATHYTLKEAGFRVADSENAAGVKWTKLLVNMMGNATSAILDEKPQTLFTQADLVDLELQAWREALAVMRALRITPVNLSHYPLRWLPLMLAVVSQPILRYILRDEVMAGRGQKWPSLRIDLEGGRGRSEIPWLNGAVVTHGEALGIATPVNRVLTETVLALTADPARRAEWRGNTARLLAAVKDLRRRPLDKNSARSMG